MNERASTTSLADVNLWIATVHTAHPHHERAVEWWRGVAGRRGVVLFCRVTQLGLLRLLSNERVMGPSRRSPRQAWRTYAGLVSQGVVAFGDEPRQLQRFFEDLTDDEAPSVGLWTDAYLAAFALAGNVNLATFDRGFRRFRGLKLDLLDP